jgi:hypothetical protein
MPYFYWGFGLGIAADQAIPGLVSAVRPRRIDTRIWLHAPYPDEAFHGCSGAPWYASMAEEREEPTLRAWRLADGDYVRLVYLDGPEFVVDRHGDNVWARWPPASTLEDTATYLLGPVLGFVLRLKGITCLHGSAVSFRDSAVALVGPQGAGKSTSAAAFCQRQQPVLSDDIVPIVNRHGSWFVDPTYPQLRLWGDAVGALYGDSAALPALTPTWDKRALDLTGPGCRFDGRRLKLAAVYLLDPRDSAMSPSIELLNGRRGLLALLGNTYVSYLLDNGRRESELNDLGALIAEVPVRRISFARDFSALPALCSAILADCESLACTA